MKQLTFKDGSRIEKNADGTLTVIGKEAHTYYFKMRREGKEIKF